MCRNTEGRLTFSNIPVSGLCHVSILMKKSSFMYSFWKADQHIVLYRYWSRDADADEAQFPFAAGKYVPCVNLLTVTTGWTPHTREKRGDKEINMRYTIFKKTHTIQYTQSVLHNTRTRRSGVTGLTGNSGVKWIWDMFTNTFRVCCACTRATELRP